MSTVRRSTAPPFERLPAYARLWPFAGRELTPSCPPAVEGCDYSNKDLSTKVLSGIRARGADFSGSIFGPEVSRADFSMAKMRGTQLSFSNLYQVGVECAPLPEGAHPPSPF